MLSVLLPQPPETMSVKEFERLIYQMRTNSQFKTVYTDLTASLQGCSIRDTRGNIAFDGFINPATDRLTGKNILHSNKTPLLSVAYEADDLGNTEVIGYHPGGTIRYSSFRDQEDRLTKELAVYQEGKMVQRFPYEQGYLHGLYQDYHPIKNRPLKRTFAFQHDVVNGAYERKNEAGHVECLGQFREGKPVDSWRLYDDKGRRLFKTFYTDDGCPAELRHDLFDKKGPLYPNETNKKGQRIGRWAELHIDKQIVFFAPILNKANCAACKLANSPMAR